MPWIAGLYALACQVDPDITPAVFSNQALATGRTIRIKKDALELDFGTFADPIRLIELLIETPRKAPPSKQTPAPRARGSWPGPANPAT